MIWAMNTTTSREHVAAIMLALALIAVSFVVTRGHPSCVPDYLRAHGWHVGSPAHYCELAVAHR
jgi:hypothetical protein